jgi:hypothetical protein
MGIKNLIKQIETFPINKKEQAIELLALLNLKI